MSKEYEDFKEKILIHVMSGELLAMLNDEPTWKNQYLRYNYDEKHKIWIKQYIMQRMLINEITTDELSDEEGEIKEPNHKKTKFSTCIHPITNDISDTIKLCVCCNKRLKK